jgi:hypothetical protein
MVLIRRNRGDRTEPRRARRTAQADDDRIAGSSETTARRVLSIGRAARQAGVTTTRCLRLPSA